MSSWPLSFTESDEQVLKEGYDLSRCSQTPSGHCREDRGAGEAVREGAGGAGGSGGPGRRDCIVQAGDDGAMTRCVRARWEKLLAFGCISDAAPIGFADRLEVGVRKGEVKDSPRSWPEQLEQSCPLGRGHP